MLRLRFFKILLPLLLVVVAGLVIWSLKPRSAVHSPPLNNGTRKATVVEELSFVEFKGGTRSVAGDADLFEPLEDGRLHLEGIRDLEIEREGRGPLVVSASRGDRNGAEGERMWLFEEQVVFRDTEEGLKLNLPKLEVDESAGEARSSGDIRFEAPYLSGTAASLVYGLRGQPGHLGRPVLVDEQGGRLTSDWARLHDGIRDIELVGQVSASLNGQRLDAGRVRLWRGPSDRLRRSVATEGVRGLWPMGPGDPAELQSEQLEVEWDEAGLVQRMLLRGDAVLRREAELLAASTIEALRPDGVEQGWELEALHGVHVRGIFGTERGVLRAETLTAVLDRALMLEAAEASGRVSFESGETQAEAERITFSTTDRGEEIRLYAAERRKARLSRLRTRVAAAKIVTDPRGDALHAEGQVEATLLPGGPHAGPGRALRLFAAEQAVHFVASEMRSLEAGSHLDFSGSVRGWQGERNLAAEHVIVDQHRSSLEARESVSTRIPRQTGGPSLAETDYIQISADRLTYDDRDGRAVYTGDVRMRLAEGWLEAQRVEVELATESREIREVRAYETVRLELHRIPDKAASRPISGGADRVVYLPFEGIVQLVGEQSPAHVRRIGEGGGTTTGRVLRYRLDQGTLDVDSGEQGPARIRTSNG